MMRLHPLLLTLVLTFTTQVCAEEFRLLPADEDWRGSTRPLKNLKLDEKGRYLVSVGGSVRLQYESFHNQIIDGFSSTFTDSYLLQRTTLHSDFRLGERHRFFLDLQSANPIDLELPFSPVNRDEVFLHQAFYEHRFGALRAHLGRQEMHLGSGRLVSVREGPNIRLSFDAVKVSGETPGWNIQAFWGRPTEVRPGSFNNRWVSDNRWLGGLYSTSGTQEHYLLAFTNPDATYGDTMGKERRYTIGSRWFERLEDWDYDFELFYQFGDFAGQQISAWSIASNTGYHFHQLPGRPRFGLKANIVSGDTDPHDNKLGTFNALFPNGSYFGEIALLGPANLINVHPGVDFELTQEITLGAQADFFWRYSLRDGVYTPPGFLLRGPGDSRASYVGFQPDITLTYEPSEQWKLSLDHSLFIPGRFMEDHGVTDTVQFSQVSLKYRF